MVPNPCCMDLQLAVKILAILNMIGDVYIIGSFILLISVIASAFHSSSSHLEDQVEAVEIYLLVVSVIVILLSVAHFVLSCLLYVGARKRDITRCKLWLIVTIVSLCFTIAGRITSTFGIVIVTIGLFFDVYQIWVVYAFMEEVQGGQHLHHVQPTHQVHVVNYDYTTGPISYPPNTVQHEVKHSTP